MHSAKFLIDADMFCSSAEIIRRLGMEHIYMMYAKRAIRLRMNVDERVTIYNNMMRMKREW
jgi:hypothetical protein